jgi:hypothetical protein
VITDNCWNPGIAVSLQTGLAPALLLFFIKARDLMLSPDCAARLEQRTEEAPRMNFLKKNLTILT